MSHLLAQTYFQFKLSPDPASCLLFLSPCVCLQTVYHKIPSIVLTLTKKALVTINFKRAFHTPQPS